MTHTLTLELDELDYHAMQKAIAIRQRFRCWPDAPEAHDAGESNIVGPRARRDLPWLDAVVESERLMKINSFTVNNHFNPAVAILQSYGCRIVNLGAVKASPGYVVMLDADEMYYFWVSPDGREGAIHWNRWAVLHGAKADAERREMAWRTA